MPLYYPPLRNALQKTLDSQLDSGVTSAITLNNTTGVQNKPGVVVINRISSSGAELNASVREFISFTGVSGNTLTGLTRNVDGSSTDQDHAVGSVVEFVFDAISGQAIIDALLETVDDNGDLDATKVIPASYLDTDTSLTANSDTKVATQKATKAYVDTKRVVSSASYTTDTGTSLNVDNLDLFVITAQAGALLFNNPSGTPTQGQQFIIRIKDNGTARALTYGDQYRASSDLELPSTTVVNKTLYMGFVWNSTDSKWDLLAVLNNI